MDGAVFYSYKPYLQIALTRECIVTFNKNGVYIAKLQRRRNSLESMQRISETHITLSRQGESWGMRI